MAKTYCGTSTTHLTEHLRKVHRDKLKSEERDDNSTQSKLDARSFFVDLKVLRRLILEYVLDQRLSFRNSTSKSFRKIIQHLNSNIVNKLSISVNTYRDDAIQLYFTKKIVIIDHLREAKSQIHVSFDL